MISKSILSSFFTLALLTSFMSSSVFASHPLITDDTGTQGKGKFQFELNGERSRDKNGGVKTTETALAAALTYGIINELDIVVNAPWIKADADDSVQKTSENGVSDVSIEAKWRFMEKGGFSLALKPGITLPTGDEKKDLGAGKTTYSLFFITTKDLKPLLFHVNLGFIRNENNNNNEVNIWHASFATEFSVTEKMRIVANVGGEKNPDKTVDKDPAFILGGIVYAVSERFDVDFGVKAGLTSAEPDFTALAGITTRF